MQISGGIERRVRRQMTGERGFKGLNIEQQNKEPQNDEVITSIRLRRIRYSAVQKGGSSDEVNLHLFSTGFWLLTADSRLLASKFYNLQSAVTHRYLV